MSQLKRWQEANKEEAYKSIWPVVDLLSGQASRRQEVWRRYDRIYGSPYWYENDPSSPIIASQLAGSPERRLRVNRCRLHVETYVSRWMKTRCLPMVVVKGGDFQLTRRAKKFNALIEGAFEQLGVFDTDAKWCRDAAKFGVGVAYVGDDGEQPVIMRCDPFSILIDDFEWMEGQGTTIHWIRLRPKSELLAEFPEFESEINAASCSEFSHLLRNFRDDANVDLCPLVYSWSLAVGDEKKGGFKGRHCVTIRGADLVDEEYTEDTLPFAFLCRTAPTEAIWGEPLMADLAPVQETLDRYLRRVDESLWLANVIRIITRKDSGLNPEHLVNSPATILTAESPQDIQSFNMEISPQLMEFVNFSLQSMQELGRANIMATTGDMPKNIRSYKATQLLEDTDLEGLREGLRSRDSFYTRIGELLVRTFERLGKFKLVVRRKGRGAEQLSYKKLKLPKDSYAWTIMPTDFIAKTAAGRMDQAEWLVDQGLLSKDRIASFLDIPNVESEVARVQSMRDAIEMRIEKILDDGEYIMPHPFMNLNLLRKVVGEAISQAEVEGCPEDRIELLRHLVIDAANLQQAALSQQGGGQTNAIPGSLAPPGAVPGPEATGGDMMASQPIGAMQPPVQPLTAQPLQPMNEKQPAPMQGMPIG